MRRATQRIRSRLKSTSYWTDEESNPTDTVTLKKHELLAMLEGVSQLFPQPFPPEDSPMYLDHKGQWRVKPQPLTDEALGWKDTVLSDEQLDIVMRGRREQIEYQAKFTWDKALTLLQQKIEGIREQVRREEIDFLVTEATKVWSGRIEEAKKQEREFILKLLNYQQGNGACYFPPEKVEQALKEGE